MRSILDAPSSTESALVVDELGCRGLRELIESVCLNRGVTLDELCGRSRARSAAQARHELWWRIRALPDRHYSYSEIGRMFRRNTATVLQGVAAHQRVIAEPRP